MVAGLLQKILCIVGKEGSLAQLWNLKICPQNSKTNLAFFIKYQHCMKCLFYCGLRRAIRNYLMQIKNNLVFHIVSSWKNGNSKIKLTIGAVAFIKSKFFLPKISCFWICEYTGFLTLTHLKLEYLSIYILEFKPLCKHCMISLHNSLIIRTGG